MGHFFYYNPLFYLSESSFLVFNMILSGSAKPKCQPGG